MDVKDYCRSIEIELHGWKTKMYDMVRKVDKLRSADRNRVSAQVEDLHKHIEDIERIVNTLQNECPADFGPQKKEIEATQSEMKKKYEDAMAAVLQF
jgi:predicted RNase H-like nuclease